MDPANFAQLCDLGEHIIQLLQLHFFALQTIMSPILAPEQGEDFKQIIGKAPDPSNSSISRWADGLLSSFPPHLVEYLPWLRWVRLRARDPAFYDEVLEAPAVEVQ